MKEKTSDQKQTIWKKMFRKDQQPKAGQHTLNLQHIAQLMKFNSSTLDIPNPIEIVEHARELSYKVLGLEVLVPMSTIDDKTPIAVQPINVENFRNTLDRRNAKMIQSNEMQSLSAHRSSIASSINRISIKTLSGIVGSFKHRTSSVSSLHTSDNHLSSLQQKPHTTNLGSLQSQTTLQFVKEGSVCIFGSAPQMTGDSLSKTLRVMRPRTKSMDVPQTSKKQSFTSRKKLNRVIETKTIDISKESEVFVSPSGKSDESPLRINQYHMMYEIGTGAYGTVFLCKHADTSRYYACKIISKQKLKKKFRFGGEFKEMIASEIMILKKLSLHKNINSLVEVLENDAEDNLYMIFELCEHGQIMKIEVGGRVRPYNEDLVRNYFRDIVLGLEYSKDIYIYIFN